MYIKLGITSQINSPVWNIYLGTRRSEKIDLWPVFCLMPNSKLAGDVSYRTPLAFVKVQVIPKYTLALCSKTPSIGLRGPASQGFSSSFSTT